MSQTQTPLRAIRERCLWCCLGSKAEVKHCPASTCALWPFRLGRGVRGYGLSPTRAIVKYCLVCCGGASVDGKYTGSTMAVQGCNGKLAGENCPLWLWRTTKVRRMTRTRAKQARESHQGPARAHLQGEFPLADHVPGGNYSLSKCALTGVGEVCPTLPEHRLNTPMVSVVEG